MVGRRRDGVKVVWGEISSRILERDSPQDELEVRMKDVPARGTTINEHSAEALPSCR